MLTIFRFNNFEITHYLCRITLALLLAHVGSMHASSDSGSSGLVLQQFNDLVSLKELSQSPYYTKILDGYTTYSIPNPTIQKYLFNPKATKPGFIEYPEQFVMSLPQARILSNQGMIITNDNQPFFDYVHLERRQWGDGCDDWKVCTLKRDLNLMYPPEPEVFNGTIAMITAPAAYCYYHWMFEMLPRLQVLKQSGVHYDKLFIGSGNQKYKKATLDLLGIDESKIMSGEETTHIKASTVIIPSMPNLCEFTRPTWVLDFLRSSFLGSVDILT